MSPANDFFNAHIKVFLVQMSVGKSDLGATETILLKEFIKGKSPESTIFAKLQTSIFIA
jgi:hypothetical protein